MQGIAPPCKDYENLSCPVENTRNYRTFAPKQNHTRMNVEEFRDFCLSLPGTTEKMPFQAFQSASAILAFYIGGHIYCYVDIDRFDVCSMKCPPSLIDALKEAHEAVCPPHNMNPKYWIGVKFGSDLTDSEIKSLVEQSYSIVKDSRKRRKSN